MAAVQPRAGVHYPRSAGEFQSWFSTDADCLDYLDWLRWPEGFICPRCGHAGGWAIADGRYKCSNCGGRTSVTAGTLFDRRRTPLTVWFTACWMFATGKDGMSALSLQRALEIGSYPTAWAMLHRLRSVLVRPGRERLTGMVEVDETFIGGEEAGLRGGRARGKKVLTGIAVEVTQPRGMGRCRMAPLADASAKSLRAFVTDHVEPGATVITDAWQGYRGLDKLGYLHDRRSQRAARACGGPWRATARGTPSRLADQAMAAGYPPGLGGARPPAQLYERVRVPLQPAPIPQPRAGLLPGARARHRPRPGALSRPGCRPSAQDDATHAARKTGESTQHGPPASGSTMANH